MLRGPMGHGCIRKLDGCIRKLGFGNYATIHISLMPLQVHGTRSLFLARSRQFHALELLGFDIYDCSDWNHW